MRSPALQAGKAWSAGCGTASALPISTSRQSAEGETELSFGRYLSENIYTDVQIDSAGNSAASVNIDLTPSITARGSVESAGDSSIGVFFERDY